MLATNAMCRCCVHRSAAELFAPVTRCVDFRNRGRFTSSLRLKERRVVVTTMVIAAIAPRLASMCERVKGAQIGSRSKIDEGGRDRDDRAVHAKDVERWPECGRVG